MKKILSIALALALTFTLCACGTDSAEETRAEPEDTGASATPESASPEPDYEPVEMFPLEASIEETVLVDQDGIKVTATDLEYNYSSVDLNLVIENGTDQDLTFLSGTMGYSVNAVNHHMYPGGYLNADVAAGKSAMDSISFDVEELALRGITEIACLQISIQVKDDDYDIVLDSGPVEIRTSAYDTVDLNKDRGINVDYVQNEYDYSVIYSGNEETELKSGVTITSQTVLKGDDGEEVLLEVVNDSEKTYEFVTTDITVNGLNLCSSNWTVDTVTPGCSFLATIDLDSVLDDYIASAFGMDSIHRVSIGCKLENEKYEDATAVIPVEIKLSDGADYTCSPETKYDQDGIRVSLVGLAEEDDTFLYTAHILLLAENGTGKEVSIGDSFGSLSINGFMCDAWTFTAYLQPGTNGIIDIELPDYFLEDLNIESIDDIGSAEITLEIRNSNYKTIAEPVITMEF